MGYALDRRPQQILAWRLFRRKTKVEQYGPVTALRDQFDAAIEDIEYTD